MEGLRNENRGLRAIDFFYLAVTEVYLGFLLFFSALFYLATEDYEAVTAVRLIAEGHLIGKSTGWPYTPLAPYLFYLWSLLFGDGVLGFRILTACFILASVFPIYLTLRYLCRPFLSFALTLFSFSVMTFPHPRLEYFIEGALVSFAIYFAARFLQRDKIRDLYFSAFFAVAGFSSKGYPNSAILLFFIPFALVLGRWVTQGGLTSSARVQSVKRWFRETAIWISSNPVQTIGALSSIFLGVSCFILLTRFLKRAVYTRSLLEYRNVSGLTDFQIDESTKHLSDILLGILIVIYLGFALYGKPAARHSNRREKSRAAWLSKVQIAKVFFPFVLCGVLFLLGLAVSGYRFDDILFFVFPLDVFLDHVAQIGGGEVYVMPILIIMVATLLYIHLAGWLEPKQAGLGLFFLLLLPSTFSRFFPGYNMLYLAAFVVAVFICLILPKTGGLFWTPVKTAQLQNTLGTFLLLYSIGSTIALMFAAEWSDLEQGRVVKMDDGAVGKIYVEKDVAAYFDAVHESLAKLNADKSNMAFLSNRYLKFVPLVYGYHDILAGQNLAINLGKVWSYDDILAVDGMKSDLVFDWANMVYSWREVVVARLEKSKAAVVVISLYDEEAADENLEPSSDPFREYLRKNFILADVIEPTMEIPKRSSVSEGAVIFVRKRVGVGVDASSR